MTNGVTRQAPVQLPPKEDDPLAGAFGGQGPAAGADAAVIFQAEQGKMAKEQDYHGLVLYNDPNIPDRTSFIKDPSNNPDPTPQMIKLVKRLDATGVTVIFIPCNTAHVFFKPVAKSTNALVLNMIKATAKHLVTEGVKEGSTIGVMCTEGTKSQGLYTKELEKAGYKVLYPSAEQQVHVNDGIYKGVKQNDIEEGQRQMEPVLRDLLDKGCAKVLLACTEIPMALKTGRIDEKTAAKTLNPVVAVVRRSQHHLNEIKQAMARGETTYDGGSDAELSGSESEAEQRPAASQSRAEQAQATPRRSARLSGAGVPQT